MAVPAGANVSPTNTVIPDAVVIGLRSFFKFWFAGLVRQPLAVPFMVADLLPHGRSRRPLTPAHAADGHEAALRMQALVQGPAAGCQHGNPSSAAALSG